MNILVTGSAGFIGTHLVRTLETRGHQLGHMDKRYGTPTTDITALCAITALTRPNVIVHLGASCSTQVSLTDPERDFRDNAVGTFNVAEAARQAGNIPVIYTSTVKVNPGADGRIAPLGLSKRVGEDYLNLYADLYELPSVILRPSTVYGPGQDGTAESGWVTWFLRALYNRRQITIHGDGTQSRDVLYIDDFTKLLVDVCENFANYQRPAPYDVGGGPDNELSLLDLLRIWETDTGSQPDIVHDERLPGDLQRVVTDNTAINNVRGWAPITNTLDGLRSTLAWIGDQW
ncbi:NAD-dependent epimerase/dehydratase family protein [Streptomyces antibioticus]|uniref:NAD-dependent epimerase/dehydratase family protein n=1 Tax=Streptomyces antibioticus TaxID=1890 RepID=UPI0036FAE100